MALAPGRCQLGVSLDAPILGVHARDRVRTDVRPGSRDREEGDRDGDEREHSGDSATTTQRRDVLGDGGQARTAEALDRVHPLGDDADDVDRVRDALERQRAPILVSDALEATCEMVTSRVARISPARACPQSRAARFSAAPR